MCLSIQFFEAFSFFFENIHTFSPNAYRNCWLKSAVVYTHPCREYRIRNVFLFDFHNFLSLLYNHCEPVKYLFVILWCFEFLLFRSLIWCFLSLSIFFAFFAQKNVNINYCWCIRWIYTKESIVSGLLSIQFEYVSFCFFQFIYCLFFLFVLSCQCGIFDLHINTLWGVTIGTIVKYLKQADGF